MKRQCYILIRLLIILAWSMTAGSCDWIAPVGTSGQNKNVNEVYKEGYDAGFKDGSKHASPDDRTDYKGLSKSRYVEGYHLGYQHGFQATESERASDRQVQQATFNVQKSFGHQAYDYQFTIVDGRVSWQMKGGGKERKGSFGCNKKVPVHVISNEIKGMVLWRLAGNCLSSVSQGNNYGNNLRLRWGQETLMQAASLLNQVQDYCPDASKLPRQCLNELYTANESDPLSVVSTSQGVARIIACEEPAVCDLAGCDL